MIWDFFFRFDPQDIGKAQEREIERVRRYRLITTAWYRARSALLNARLTDLQRAIHAARPEVSETPTTGKDERSTTSAHAPLSELEAQVTALRERLSQLESTKSSIATVTASAEVNEASLNADECKAHLLEAERRLYRGWKDRREATAASLEQLKQDHQNMLRHTEQTTAELRAMIEALRQQMPPLPTDAEVLQWLEEDIDRIRDESIRKAGIGTRLAAISVYDHEGIERNAPNPMVFVSPGDLQEAHSIPPSYLPAHFKAGKQADRQSSAYDLFDRVSVNPFVWFSRPTPLPDHAKHFLAKRAAQTRNSYLILYGVYHIESLIVGSDMFVLFSAFYDFIRGRIMAEKIVEQYYTDIIAIERRNDYRRVPLSFEDNERFLEVEDVPTITLILAGGDRRTITFAARSYYEGILRNVEGDPSTWPDSTRQYVDAAVRSATEQADAALNVLRKCLRNHKGTA
jgi:hypothetical protein